MPVTRRTISIAIILAFGSAFAVGVYTDRVQERVRPSMEADLEDAIAQQQGLPPKLESTRVLAGDSLGYPIDLAIFESALVVLDVAPLRDTGQVLLLGRDRGQILARSGPEGQGPADLFRPSVIQPIYGINAGVWVNDYTHGRLVFYELAAIGNNPSRTVRKPGTWAHEMAWVGDSLFTSGSFVSEVLQEYRFGDDGGLAMTRALGDPLLPNLAPALRGEVNRNALAVDPSGKRFAVAFEHVSRLHFFDSDGNLIRSVAGPEEVVPDPAVDVNGQVPTMPTAYRDVTATTTHVIGLFSGRKTAYGNRIDVFDWDGHLEGRWQLDDELAAIAADPGGNVLYGLRHHPQPSIVEYDTVPWLAPTTRRTSR